MIYTDAAGHQLQQPAAVAAPSAIGKQHQPAAATVSPNINLFNAWVSTATPNPRCGGAASARTLGHAAASSARSHVSEAAASAANSNLPRRAHGVQVMHTEQQPRAVASPRSDVAPANIATAAAAAELSQQGNAVHHSPAVPEEDQAAAVQPLQLRGTPDAQGTEELPADQPSQLPLLRHIGTGKAAALNIQDKHALIARAQLSADDYSDHCASSSSQVKKSKAHPAQGNPLIPGSTFDIKLPDTAERVCTAHATARAAVMPIVRSAHWTRAV